MDGDREPLGLFASIMIHEFSHSLVARRHGLPMKGITLFIFGGVAEMGDEPADAKTEFRMAIAGPIASVILGAVLYVVYLAVKGALPVTVTGVIGYLAWINRRWRRSTWFRLFRWMEDASCGRRCGALGATFAAPPEPPPRWAGRLAWC